MFKLPTSDELSSRSYVILFWCLAVLLTLIIFLIDLQLPLGVAGGVPYVAVILIAWWLPSRSNVLALAAITSLLTVVGYIQSPPGGIPWIVITNRGLALFAIWSVAILIIQRKPAEAMLLEARDKLEIEIAERSKELDKLSVAIEQSPVSVVITDLDGTIEYVNPHFTKSSGYTFEEAVGQNPRILYSGQNDPGIFEEMWRTLMDGLTWRGDLLNKDKNGEVFWETVNISPITNKAGEIINFVGIKEDISERKSTEEELATALKFSQDAETVVRDAIESISEGFVIYDKDDRMVICNENYKKLFPTIADIMVPGVTFEELIDVGLARDQYGGVTAERDKEEIKKERMEHHNNPTGIGVNQQMADGRWMLVRERRTSSGGIAGIRADITEIKKAEEIQVKQRQIIEATLENVGLGVVMADEDGAILAHNRYFEEQFGLDIKDFPNFEDYTKAYLESFGADSETVDGYLQLLHNNVAGTWERPIPGGRVFEVTHIPLERGGYVRTYNNITERKKAEDELNLRMKETEAFNKIAVGRELKMIELKKEINELYEKSGEPKKYQIVK